MICVGMLCSLFLLFSITHFLIVVVFLWQSVLGCALRIEGEPHDCLNDAKAAMKLVLAKLEHGFDDPISIVDNNVCKK